MNTLPAHVTTFMELVNLAVFANPFSDARKDLDRQIGEVDDAQDLVDAASGKVRLCIEQLEQAGIRRLDDCAEHQRKQLQYLYLFDFFHRFIPQFDQLIERYMARPGKSVTVGFAPQALQYLIEKGFSEVEARHYFAISFQLRRAFYFIQKNLVGCSQSMKELRESLWNNVFTHNLDLYNRFLINRMEDFSTLLLGETGTGKGTASMAIGSSGFIPFDPERKCFCEDFTRTFISINLSQYPETLIESELFGHKKGAFTGANEEHRGVFSLCSPHGAIFLDEIGEVSISVQIKLLKVLQERLFSPVGSHEQLHFSGRVIAATNKAREELETSHTFRSDFYYRLCSDIITVPPLRTRIQQDARELEELLAHTVARLTGEPSRELTTMVYDRIVQDLGMAYQWPGNVRELEQCTRRILLKGTYAGVEHHAPVDPFLRSIATGSLTMHELAARYCRLLYDRYGSYQEVAMRTELDWRTVKKYVTTE